jgi:hypothetical protein
VHEEVDGVDLEVLLADSLEEEEEEDLGGDFS